MLEHIAQMLGIKDYKDLETELIMKEKIKNLKDRVPETINIVKNNIASLAKALYDNMFNWLVVKMN